MRLLLRTLWLNEVVSGATLTEDVDPDATP